MIISLELTPEVEEMVNEFLGFYFSGTPDIFSGDISGTWLETVTTTMTSHLAHHDQGESLDETFDSDWEAVAAFKKGKQLPEQYYVIDRNLGLRVVALGLLTYGIAFVDGRCDAIDLDRIIQEVLLGEVVYS